MTTYTNQDVPGKQARASELITLAHELLLGMLQKDRAKGLSSDHSLALWELMSAFTNQALKTKLGRFAYALPCGAGKTTGVIAWIVAQYRLGLGISVAVSSQQIEALCDIKTKLIEAGVPESLIGIRHSKGSSVKHPDTGNLDRPIMLASHARIQGASEMPEFCRYQGAPRDLLIWDESLISADATVLEVPYTQTAIKHFAQGNRRPLLNEILRRFDALIIDEKVSQASGNLPKVLTLISKAESEAALKELGNPYCRHPGEQDLSDRVKQALALMAQPITLLNVGNGNDGNGLMRYQIVISPEFENIAVLDASYVVRELCKADRTIRHASTAAMLEFKSYRKVLVKHTPEPSGRCKFRGSKANAARAIQAAVSCILSISKDEPVLVFTYKSDGASCIVSAIKAELREHGVDPDESLPTGQPRIAFNTWGKHTTDNSYRHCMHVVLLGVQRLPKLQLGAAMAGQKDDLAFRPTSSELQDVEYAELASYILQAANRGNCREVDEYGDANPMTIHLVTKEKQLKPLLEKAMPGLQWETVESEPQTDIASTTKTQRFATMIVDYLLSLSAEVTKISTKTLYAAIDIQLGKDSKSDALKRALHSILARAKLCQQSYWVHEKNSLIRVSS